MTFPSGLRRECDEPIDRRNHILHKTIEDMSQTLDRAVESGSIYRSNQLSSYYNLNDRIA
jgi:hypothetical protein